VNIEDQVAAMFAKANPVPSLDLLDPIEPMDVDSLKARSERSSEMTDVDTISPTKENRQEWPRVALGLAMAVIALVALGFLANRESEVATPLAIATAFSQALSDQDQAAVDELLATDANVQYGNARWEYERAAGWVFSHLGCDEKSTGPDGTVVSCRYSADGSWMQALGLEPEVGADILLIRDGQVQQVTEDPDYPQPNVGTAYQAFRDFVTRNHAEDVATMYDSGNPRYTPEAVALWKQYTDEFVADMEAPG
jgi:hypothetical protein